VSAIAGCGHRDKSIENAAEVVGVAQLGTDLAYVQSDGLIQRLNVLVADPKPVTAKVQTTTAPRLVVKRPSHDVSQDEMLVVADGSTDQHGQVQQAPSLTSVNAQGATKVYPLAARGQQMRTSDDGHFAILFQDPSYVDDKALLTNPGEVAIVDLLAAPEAGKNPTIRNLDTVGGPPNSVSFPALTLAPGGEPRAFAFFTFPNGASLIDLAKPTEPGHKLDLTGWVSAGGISPNSGFAMAAAPSGNELFLKTSSSQFVEVVSVVPSASNDGSVDVSLKQLTVGTVPPGAISVYSTSVAGTQLVATLGNQVALVDTDEDSVTAVSLPHAANQILMFQGASPNDTGVKQRALLYAAGQTGASFVDLESLASEQERALSAVEFGASISVVREVPFLQGQVLVFLANGGVDILDLTTRHWSPIDSPVALTLVVADDERNRVWVSAPGDERISFLDFGSGAQSTLTVNHTVQLDDPVQLLFRVGAAGNARVVVSHDEPGGAVTLLDAAAPQRATAQKLEGFLYSDLL
jgi:hypothetical protein